MHPLFYRKADSLFSGIEKFRASPRLMPGRAVVLRIEPPLVSRPFGFHH